MTEREYYEYLFIAFINESQILGYDALAYTEADEDIIFWKKIFQTYKPTFHIDFRAGIPSATTHNPTTGIGQLRKIIQYQLAQYHLFVCLDSEYNAMLRQHNYPPFVFQTYSHSIENHQSYLDTFVDILGSYSNETLQNRKIQDFIAEYSCIIYDIFICFLYNKQNEGDFFPSDKAFYDCLKMVDIKSIESSFFRLKETVNQIFKSFIVQYEDFNLVHEKTKYTAIGLNETNIYLYLQGHFVADNLIKPFLRELRRVILQKDANHQPDFYFSYQTNYAFLNHQYPELQAIKKDIITFFPL